MNVKVVLLAIVLLVSCNNSNQKENQNQNLRFHPNGETVDEFQKRLGIDKIEALFVGYEESENYVSFCQELDTLFNNYVDTLFANVDIKLLTQDLNPSEDTTLYIGFAKEKFRIETIHEYCAALFFNKNYRIDQCNVYRYGAEEQLMFKYYNLALSLLEPEDRQLLERDQKLWEQSFENSQDISLLITEPKYGNTGGREMSLFHLYSMRPNMLERAEYLFIWYKHLKEGRYSY